MVTPAEIKKFYAAKKRAITARLADFRRIWDSGSDEDLFAELAFCIMTPQSKAKSCWTAIETLRTGKLLLSKNAKLIAQNLYGVRFHNNKAGHLVAAHDFLLENGKIRIRARLEAQGGIKAKRDWLVKNIKGFGYKEASHFLRNIGLGRDIAILDRHILRNLVALSVLKELPQSITPKKYHEIEEKMKKFGTELGIPVSHLDIVFWCKETGEIFK